MTYFLKLNLHLEWVSDLRFFIPIFLLDFSLRDLGVSNFFQSLKSDYYHLEELRKIEGYTRDAKSSKVFYFRCKELKIIKISHFQAIA